MGRFETYGGRTTYQRTRPPQKIWTPPKEPLVCSIVDFCTGKTEQQHPRGVENVPYEGGPKSFLGVVSFMRFPSPLFVSIPRWRLLRTYMEHRGDVLDKQVLEVLFSPDFSPRGCSIAPFLKKKVDTKRGLHHIVVSASLTSFLSYWNLSVVILFFSYSPLTHPPPPPKSPSQGVGLESFSESVSSRFWVATGNRLKVDLNSTDSKSAPWEGG